MQTVENKYNFGDKSDHYDESVLSKLSPHILLAIENYVQHGSYLGDFLTAVMDNDLRMAIGRADDDNVHAMREIIVILNCYCPSDCWGGKDKRVEWQKHHGMDGLQGLMV